MYFLLLHIKYYRIYLSLCDSIYIKIRWDSYMNRLVKAILQQVPVPVFTTLEISHLVHGSANTRHALVKRAIDVGDIIHIKRGLHTLSPLYRKRELNPFCVSQMIVTLSYISLEISMVGYLRL